MRLADDAIIECSPAQNADLFYATVGGMGLLGHILEVEVALHRIPTQWLLAERARARHRRFPRSALARGSGVADDDGVDRLRAPRELDGAGDSDRRPLGHARRDVGRSSARKPARWTFPFRVAQLGAQSAVAVARMFNAAYYWRHFRRRGAAGTSPPDPFSITRSTPFSTGTACTVSRGFTQYQCVLPRAAGGVAAVREFMERLTKLGGASPLWTSSRTAAAKKGRGSSRSRWRGRRSRSTWPSRRTFSVSSIA